MRRTALILLALASACAVPGEPPASPPCPEGFLGRGDGLCWREDRLAQLVPPVDHGEPCDERPPGDLDALCTATYPGDLQFTTEDAMAEFCEQWDCVAGGILVGGSEDAVEQEPNRAITTLEPLSCLVHARFVNVTVAENLASIELPNLHWTSGGTTLGENRRARSVSLPQLTWIGGDLSIQNNDALESLDLPGLKRVGGFFYVRNNRSLPNAQARAVRDSLCREGVGGATTIAQNADG